MLLTDKIILEAKNGNEAQMSVVVSTYMRYMLALARMRETRNGGGTVWSVNYDLMDELEHQARIATVKFEPRVKSTKETEQ
ncbi:helix-turn-helix domain-containing protein [Eubacteriales bacterium OttesenSCG-928-N13]|nr:helix-turn-helix domain-containing protein [Eubacteriales bacterium OttesenSCG-928-N13]